MHVVIEERKRAAVCKFLEPICQAFKHLGHDVERWEGPMSSKSTPTRPVPPADLGVVWNGMQRYEPYLSPWCESKTPMMFAEYGFHPSRDFFQLAWDGINVGARWHPLTLRSTGLTPRRADPKGDILVILQSEDYVKYTHAAPEFPTMSDWVEFLHKNTNRRLLLRKHPTYKDTGARLDRLVADSRVVWARREPLVKALKRTESVATINSTAAVGALAAGCVVFCFGPAPYRHRGVVVQLSNDVRQARAAIAGGGAVVYEERIAELLKRLLAQQWILKDLPGRLERLLTEMK